MMFGLVVSDLELVDWFVSILMQCGDSKSDSDKFLTKGYSDNDWSSTETTNAAADSAADAAAVLRREQPDNLLIVLSGLFLTLIVRMQKFVRILQ